MNIITISSEIVSVPVPVFSLLSPDITLIEPRSGWNPSLQSRDKLRWANLFVHERKKGLSVTEAEKVAFTEMYSQQIHGLIYKQ